MPPGFTFGKVHYFEVSYFYLWYFHNVVIAMTKASYSFLCHLNPLQASPWPWRWLQRAAHWSKSSRDQLWCQKISQRCFYKIFISMFVGDAHWTPVTGVNNSSHTALMAMLGSFDQNPFVAESELYKFTKNHTCPGIIAD